MMDSIAILFPVLNELVPRAIFVVALLTFLVAVNVRGVKAGVRLYVFNTLAKLVPLLLLLVVGLFAIDVNNLAIPEWPTAERVAAGTIILFYAFTGENNEVHYPNR